MAHYDDQVPSPPAAPPINGKDEMNLAEFPIARLGRNDTRLTIEYTGQITDKTGTVLEQQWLVSGSATFGLPTEFADRVLVALMVITAKESFANRRVPFTIYRVLKLLGLSHNKRNYGAVEKALQQLVGVTIYSEGAFWDHAQQKRVTTKKGFHILEEFWLKSSEDDDIVTETESINGYVIWSERLWNSFQAGYIKNLDIDFYYSLEHTLARRLFRFLDKRMHYQDTYQIDIFDLAARLGMKPYTYASQVARKLKPAFEELQATGYLERADIIKVGTYTRARFVRTSPSKRSQTWAENATQVPRGTEEALKRDTVPTTPISRCEALYERYSTSDHLKQVWGAVLREYERMLPVATFAMLTDSALVEVKGQEAVIGVDKRYREWIERQMRRQMSVLLNHHLGTTEKIKDIQFIAI
jgi:plasmid replication initiation protein